jgi:capsular polysaccharide transport system permease protein
MVMLSSLRALFMHEITSRLVSRRFGWFWIFAEPMLHMSYLVLLYSYFRIRNIGGIDIIVWLIIGMMGYSLFRDVSIEMTSGIKSSRGLLSYRQVKPFDVIFVRALLEGFLLCVVNLLFFFIVVFLGRQIILFNGINLITSVIGLWFLGLGTGLILSIINVLFKEISMIIKFLMTPLYILSGVILPIQSIPQPYQDWLMLNPIAHGIEGMRLSFGEYYHVNHLYDLGYLFSFASILVFLGLLLYIFYADAIIKQ